MLVYYVIAILVTIIDQLSKYWIKTHVSINQEIPIIGHFFVITSLRNKGAAFSMLQNQRWLFVGITIVIAVAIIWYMRRTIRSRKRLLTLSLSLILGGAVGNFIDRLLTGKVIDFLQFNFHFHIFGKYINYTFAIFNIADSAITIGVILMIIEALISWIKEERTTSA